MSSVLTDLTSDSLDTVEGILIASFIISFLIVLIAIEQICVTRIEWRLPESQRDDRPLLFFRCMNLCYTLTETIYLLLCILEYEQERHSNNNNYNNNNTNNTNTNSHNNSNIISLSRYIIDGIRYIFLSIVLLTYCLDSLEYKYFIHIGETCPNIFRIIFVSIFLLFNLLFLCLISMSLFIKLIEYWYLITILIKFVLIISILIYIISLIHILFKFNLRINYYKKYDTTSQNICKNNDIKLKIFHANCRLISIIAALVVFIAAQGICIYIYIYIHSL